MHRPFIINRHLNEHWTTLSNEYMAKKLQNAKPKINMKCPESFEFYKTQFHRTSVRNSKCKIYFYITNIYKK
jgi:hypothetical protein